MDENQLCGFRQQVQRAVWENSPQGCLPPSIWLEIEGALQDSGHKTVKCHLRALCGHVIRAPQQSCSSTHRYNRNHRGKGERERDKKYLRNLSAKLPRERHEDKHKEINTPRHIIVKQLNAKDRENLSSIKRSHWLIIHHIRRKNMINNEFPIRNNGGQKTVERHIQGTERKNKCQQKFYNQVNSLSILRVK